MSKIKMERLFISLGISNIEFIRDMTMCENPSQMESIESGIYFDADVDINWYDESILGPSFEEGLKQIIKYPNCYPTDLKELFEDYKLVMNE